MGIIGAVWNQVAYIIRDKILNGVIRIINAITQFFNRVFTMMQKVVGIVEKKISRKLEGMGHFVERNLNGEFANVYQGFHVDEVGDWNETIARKSLPLEEVPDKYRLMINESQINDTKEIEASLEM